MEDSNTDTLKSRATTVTALLADPKQLSKDGISKCTQALVQTVENASEEDLGTEGVTDPVALALSRARACELNDDDKVRVDAATAKLSQAMQKQMTVGEEPKIISTENARISTVLDAPADVAGKKYSTPMTELEKLEGTKKTSLTLQKEITDGAAAVGVSLIELMNEAGESLNSMPTGLKVSEYTFDEDGSGRRRLTPRHLEGKEPTKVTIDLVNSRSQSYPDSLESTGKVECEGTEDLEINCPNQNSETGLFYNQTLAITDCKSGRKYSYTCPVSKFEPACTVYDLVSKTYVENEMCVMKSQTDTVTTCECTLPDSTSSDGRRLSLSGSSESDTYQFSSKTKSVSADIEAELDAAASAAGIEGEGSGMVLAGIGGAFGALLFIAIAYFYKRHKASSVGVSVNSQAQGQSVLMATSSSESMTSPTSDDDVEAGHLASLVVQDPVPEPEVTLRSKHKKVSKNHASKSKESTSEP
eukprot:GSChrysophyteH1.ASY1.ANO1.1630.1 assembled CDS